MKGNKFYNTNWFMWVMLIFFAPVGIFIMWKNKRFSKALRSILSAVFAFVFISAMAPQSNSNEINTQSNNKSTYTNESVNKEDNDAVDKGSKNDNDSSSSENLNKEAKEDINKDKAAVGTEPTNNKKETKKSVTGNLKVHYINVGQADSILIQQNNQNMLIDAGNNADSDLVINYLNSQGISKLDYIIGTHPHEDHIGGMDKVIGRFDIGKVYMPKAAATTATYKDVISAIRGKELKITTPVVGSTFKLGSATATILAPSSSHYEDANNHSIVIKLGYGNNNFLFMGDAEDISEEEILSKQLNVKADVLKVGHHGSSSSTTQRFLNKVSPKYAVITVGVDNSYGHPHKSTIDRLKSKEIKVYRTDESGTIIVNSDGNNITFNVSPGSYSYNGSGSTKKSSSGVVSTAKSIPKNTSIPKSTSKSSSSTTKVSKPSTPSSNNNSGKKSIKGNINSKGEKIYHVPGGAYYDRTNPEEWFSTETEAEVAGYRKSKR